MLPREINDNAYAKFWAANKVYLGNVQIVNALYYEWNYRIRKPPFLSHKSEKPASSKKLHSGDRFRKPSFLVPDHLLVESKMEKKNLRIRVDRALINICYETKSRNLKC